MAFTIAAISVLAAGLLLLLILQMGDDDSAAAPPGAPAESGERAARPPRADHPDRPGAPQVTTRERRSSDSDPGDYVETVIDGAIVRDHRRDKSKPLPEFKPRQRAPGARQIKSTLTVDISNRILPIVRKCAANIPADARGTKPRLEGEITIAIRSQQVQVTQATLEVRDVVDSAVDSVKQCISPQVVGLTVPAGDERDLDEYSITLNYPL